MMRNKLFWTLLIVAGLFALPAAVHADLVWDAIPDNSGVDEGAGTWQNNDASYKNWTADGGATNQVWDNSNPTIAQFGNTYSTSEYDIDIDANGVTSTGLRFYREYRIGQNTPDSVITLQGVDNGTEKVANIIANARGEFYCNMTNSADTDKVVIRSDDTGATDYIEWGGVGNYSCVVQIGDDTGAPEFAMRPMVYSPTAINDNCPEVRVMPNSQLYLRTAHVFNAPLTLMGTGYGGTMALYLYTNESGWGGDITLAGDVLITSRADRAATTSSRTYLNGDISETPGEPKSLTIDNVSYCSNTELTGTNTYTGDTIIRNNVTDPNIVAAYTIFLKSTGSIAYSRAIDIGAGAALDVTEQAGGWSLGASAAQVLKGNGSVVGDVIAATDGTIAPGDSIGTLTITGNLALGGTLEVEYDGAAAGQMIDLLAVDGDLDLTNATFDFTQLAGGSALTGEPHVFVTYTGVLTGAAAAMPPAGYQVDYNTAGQIALTVVPEPATWLLLLLVGLTLAVYKCREA
ncbi:MAG: PEP-CTERM sorting domain-containing protein [Pirellulales bacterium]|nr:PEP-CTERM sorting domain-containing protein [Pirellulales bacterium]